LGPMNVVRSIESVLTLVLVLSSWYAEMSVTVLSVIERDKNDEFSSCF